jgi:hypothetical protein
LTRGTGLAEGERKRAESGRAARAGEQGKLGRRGPSREGREERGPRGKRERGEWADVAHAGGKRRKRELGQAKGVWVASFPSSFPFFLFYTQTFKQNYLNSKYNLNSNL